jgi:hypothetical protein
MFEKSSPQVDKQRGVVRFLLTDNRTIEGEVFVAQGERLVDVLNDSRGFIPVSMGQGDVRSIAKTQIAEARDVGASPKVETDPWKILRVQRGATPAEVREAWRARIKSCHPDRVAALGMDKEIEYAARQAAQKINMAYDEIITEMKSRASADASVAQAAKAYKQAQAM